MSREVDSRHVRGIAKNMMWGVGVEEEPTLARGNAITTSTPVSVCRWVGGLG